MAANALKEVFGELDELFEKKETRKLQSQQDRDTLEVPFQLRLTGRRGRLIVHPDQFGDGVSTKKQDIPSLHATVSSVAPPSLQPREWLESVLDPRSILSMSSMQLLWSPFTENSPLVSIEKGGSTLVENGYHKAVRIKEVPNTSEIGLKRDKDGGVIGWEEIKTESEATASNSTKLTRKLANPRDFSRGSNNNKPFRPGGFEQKAEPSDGRIKEGDLSFLDVLFKEPSQNDKKLMAMLQKGPPGFEGIDFFQETSIAPEKKLENSEGVFKTISNKKGFIDTQLEVDEKDLETAQIFSDQVQERRAIAQQYYDDEKAELDRQRAEAEEEARLRRMRAMKAGGGPKGSNVPPLLRALRNFGGDTTRGQSINEYSITDILEMQGKDTGALSLPENKGDAKLETKLQKSKTWAFMSNEPVENFHEQIPDMAIKYPFELDRFQKLAVLHVERSECVFVAAHTSAGKTVVAEYAIALCCKHMTRAIYTSPIKTLSNQKFREFRKTFGEKDVGLITGDVSINPEGTCLILTTEILRSMLYRGADLIRDIEWVIFDEVHYINDRDRGVVWEETIMMLPDHVRIVMLSATVPNTFEFADWVGRTKKKPVYVVSTYKRPVPLQHYLFCHGKIFKILNEHGQFRTDGFRQARLEKKRIEKEAGKSKSGGTFGRSRWNQLIQRLLKLELLPVVVFSFSRKQCEELSYALGGINLNDNKEKGLVFGFVDRSVSRLQKVDRKLPQVRRVRELAARGIGVHHAGMLPLLKEVVEMLFGRGLIKVLFATETFAMGVNMPTRTVVFNGTRKHDGTQFRELLPSEYTQMAGRAGRRGLDSFGVVILFCRNDELPAETNTRHLLTGKATRLESKFRLTYNMILQLLRQEDITALEFIKHSFSEAPARRAAPVQKAALENASTKLKKLPTAICQMEMEYLATRERMEILFRREVAAVMNQNSLHGKFLGPGRILLIRLPLLFPLSLDSPYPAIILGSSSTEHTYQASSTSKSLVCLAIAPKLSTEESKKILKESKVTMMDDKGIFKKGISEDGMLYAISVVRPENIARICKQKAKINAEGCLGTRSAGGGRFMSRRNLGEASPIESCVKILSTLAKKAEKMNYSEDKMPAMWPEYPGLLELDPRKDMRIKDLSYIETYEERRKIQRTLALSECYKQKGDEKERRTKLEAARSALTLERRISRLKTALSDDRVAMLGELEQRVGVLQALNYVGKDREVLLKGRVASELDTCDCLIGTEMVFENILETLDDAEAVALVSTLVAQKKSNSEVKLTSGLTAAVTRLQEIALAIGNIQLKHGIDISPIEFSRNSINTSLVQVTYEWARGTPFFQICELTDVPEGSITRCILRLHETLTDIRNAARVIGDPQLYQSMERCAELIKRDIVFAASLYVS